MTLWQKELRQAFRPDLSNFGDQLEPLQERLRKEFPVVIPPSFFNGDGPISDGVWRQFIPDERELAESDWSLVPLAEKRFEVIPGVIKKYEGRVLVTLTSSCAVHCRYCFRRHHEYPSQPFHWQSLVDYLTCNESVHEVILSGGDPLTLSDHYLRLGMEHLQKISSVKTLRIHTRVPIVLPTRIHEGLMDVLRIAGKRMVVVLHMNHPDEMTSLAAVALDLLNRNGVTLLNQSVLLRGVNDDIDTLVRLSHVLHQHGIMPYYLHQLDRVRGAEHFEVHQDLGRALIDEMKRRLPGYLVPRYVQEILGNDSKSSI